MHAEPIPAWAVLPPDPHVALCEALAALPWLAPGAHLTSTDTRIALGDDDGERRLYPSAVIRAGEGGRVLAAFDAGPRLHADDVAVLARAGILYLAVRAPYTAAEGARIAARLGAAGLLAREPARYHPESGAVRAAA